MNIYVSLAVGLGIKILMVLLTLLTLVAVRQTTLMDRVVNVSMGNWFKTVAWGFFFVSLVLTLGVILIV